MIRHPRHGERLASRQPPVTIGICEFETTRQPLTTQLSWLTAQVVEKQSFTLTLPLKTSQQRRLSF